MKNQAANTWACDFTVVTDWLFRQWYVFVVMELKTRRIVQSVSVFLSTEKAVVQLDSDQVGLAHIRTAVQGAGYERVPASDAPQSAPVSLGDFNRRLTGSAGAAIIGGW